jgi:aerobic-type carbon monoxide dehydrogenase small subunit (CoxS/CutS family)
MTLAELLREELGLTGTKVGCNRGECGSCTVVINGEAVYSCSLLAIEAAGKNVLTVEGLEQNGTLHPLQQAFMDHDALQCGYCTPGMLMSLVALLNRRARPTAEDIRQAIAGNACRCGCFPNIIGATLDASRAMDH